MLSYSHSLEVSLTIVTIPDDKENIGVSLTIVIIPDDMENIGVSLTIVIIPDDKEEIGCIADYCSIIRIQLDLMKTLN